MERIYKAGFCRTSYRLAAPLAKPYSQNRASEPNPIWARLRCCQTINLYFRSKRENDTPPGNESNSDAESRARG